MKKYHKGYPTESLSRMVRAGTNQKLREVAQSLDLYDAQVVERAIDRLAALKLKDRRDFLLPTDGHNEERKKRKSTAID